jgi:glycosyltransferase (activator-dependent family)
VRVLFATIAEKSHVFAQVPMAWAMAAAGHEVRIASGPAMAEVISRTGLTAVPVGEDHTMHELLRSLQESGSIENEIADWSEPFSEDLTWPEVLLKYQAGVPFGYQPYNDPILDGLVEFARSWRPDLVIWDPVTYAGPVAARVVGAAHARLLWTLDIYSTMRETWRRLCLEQPPTRRQDPLREWLGRVLDAYGSSFDEEVVTGQWSIDQVPGRIQLPLGVSRVPVRYVAYNGPSVVPGWVSAPPDRPRVAMSMGNSLDVALGKSLVPVGEVLEALADVDAEVVALVGGELGEAAGKVPDNVRLVDFVPLHALLPTCSAIVHHGGFGTWSTAALYGVPQFLLPIKHADLWVKARRTAEAGAGLYLHAPSAKAEDIRDGVVRLLEDPRFAAGAGALRQEMAETPTPNAIVAELERLVEKHGSGTAASGS